MRDFAAQFALPELGDISSCRTGGVVLIPDDGLSSRPFEMLSLWLAIDSEVKMHRPQLGAPMLLKPGDIFEDREVNTAEADKLAHAQIAEQLAELVMTVRTPSNIALYGPWGSGKSGIGNLLHEAVKERKGVKFVRFDAYKYAEAPLRRNFISAVATQLNMSNTKYHADLYTGRTHTEIGIPASKIIRIIVVFITLLLGVSAVLAAILAIIAILQRGPFDESFARLAGQTANAALVPAALLSALITLSSKTLQVDRSLNKPESDEQFEALFTDLVSDSKAHRLVIFVDEIDRCAAEDVVATLDAVRTFLGVNKCVFVIAADQQVLEQSLTRAAKQETPSNEVNPYYSTGSAYLDKVFQYQMSLPPLLSQRITKFAADLVKLRDGLWSEISSEYVVSVLVPTHVSSPRRVKHLLNAFALSYRLAEDRHRQGLLSEDPRVGAASLAKLVCMTVEFPLFARDLQIDARLPEIVLSILASPDESAFDRSWPHQAVERASAYALQHEAPANFLTEEAGDSEGSAERTVASSNEQLIDYLRRTSAVVGPTRDLVFMQSSGAAFGLDGQLALAVENAAENADIATVSKRLTGSDQDTKRGIVDLLNHLMRTSVGLGASNVAVTFLNLYSADPTLPVGHVADAASESIALLADTHREILDYDTVEAGWNLAALGSSDGAHRLRESILTRAESTQGIDTTFILRNPGPALAENRSSVAKLAAAAIVRDGGQTSVEALGDLPDVTLGDFLKASRSTIATALKVAFNEHNQTSEMASAAATRPLTATTPTGSGITDASNDPSAFDPEPITSALVELARERIDNTEVREQLVLLLLAIDVQPGRDAVESILPDIQPVHSGLVVDALLDAGPRRGVSSWPRWFAAIDASAIEPRHSKAIQRANEILWDRISGSETLTVVSVRQAVDALMYAVNQLPVDLRPNLSTVVADEFISPITDEGTAEARAALAQKLEPLLESKLVDRSDLCKAVLPSLHDTLSANFGAVVSKDSHLGRFMLKDVAATVRDGVAASESGLDVVQQLIDDVRSSPWFEEPFNTELQLSLITASGLGAVRFQEPPNLSHIITLVEEFGPSASGIVELWLSATTPAFDDVLMLVKKLRAHSVVNDNIAEVVAAIRRNWSHEQRVALVRSEIADPDAGRLSAVDSSILGLSDVEDVAIADVLIDRFRACHNNTQRRALIDVWKTARLSDDTARRRMIQSVVIALLQPTDGSRPAQGQTEIALDALSHLGNPLPYGVKTTLGDAVQNAVAGSANLTKKAASIMVALGYGTKRHGLFGLRKSVDYTG